MIFYFLHNILLRISEKWKDTGVIIKTYLLSSSLPPKRILKPVIHYLSRRFKSINKKRLKKETLSLLLCLLLSVSIMPARGI